MMTYDEKCAELAEHFLADYQFKTQRARREVMEELARRIQCAVEDYLGEEQP